MGTPSAAETGLRCPPLRLYERRPVWHFLHGPRQLQLLSYCSSIHRLQAVPLHGRERPRAHKARKPTLIVQILVEIAAANRTRMQDPFHDRSSLRHLTSLFVSPEDWVRRRLEPTAAAGRANTGDQVVGSRGKWVGSRYPFGQCTTTRRAMGARTLLGAKCE
jgi:hypothetical protein